MTVQKMRDVFCITELRIMQQIKPIPLCQRKMGQEGT